MTNHNDFSVVDPNTRDELEHRLQEADNKALAWKDIAPKIGFDISWTTAKPLLEAAGINIYKKLPFTSVSEYKEFWTDYLSTPNASKEKLNNTTYCPPPTEGIYADIEHFNGIAIADRQTLLHKANSVAKEKPKCLPLVYAQGFPMSWDDLKVLMIANGFRLCSAIEPTKDETGKQGQRTYEYFVDLKQGSESSSTAEDADYIDYIDLDEKRQNTERKNWTFSQETIGFVEQMLDDGFVCIKRTKERESKIIDAAMQLGVKEILRRRREKTLKYTCPVTQNVKTYIDG